MASSAPPISRIQSREAAPSDRTTGDDRRPGDRPADYPDEVLSRIAPIGYKHINLRGILTFDLTRLGPSLLGRQPGAAEKRASS